MRATDKWQPGASVAPMIALRWRGAAEGEMREHWCWGSLSFWQLVRHRLSPQLQVWVQWVSDEDADLERWPITVTLPQMELHAIVLNGGLCFRTSYQMAVDIASSEGQVILHKVRSEATGPRQRVISDGDLEVI